MKFFILLLTILACANANPSWYYKLKPKTAQTLIGYGSGANEVQAKRDALNSIASQISVQIDNSFSSTTTQNGDEVKSKVKDRVKQRTKASLQDYKRLKVEFVDGKYFVALSYENIPLFDKFVKKLQYYKIKKHEHQNSYIKHTQIAKKLKKAIKFNVDFSLKRKNKQWFIKYKRSMQLLSKKDFAKFFVTIPHAKLTINTNKAHNILYDGDRFFFKVKSAQDGFVSIFTVYEDGTVSTLVRNIAVKKGVLENIPDADFETIPEAGLMKRGVETYDLYVLLYSEKKLRFDSFAYADSELVNEEKYKNFDELIDFLDTQTFTTLKVITKPR